MYGRKMSYDGRLPIRTLIKCEGANEKAGLEPISWLCGGANKNADMKVKTANQEPSLDIISWLCGEPIRLRI